uniref:Uncharacterized protein n=1 Tax=Amphimedon queenslandica TaxID=400682 RepID=A0A1X7VG48_AMPQE
MLTWTVFSLTFPLSPSPQPCSQMLSQLGFFLSLLLHLLEISYIPATTLPKWFDAELRHKLQQVCTLRRSVNKASHASEYLIHKLQHMESQLQLDIVFARKCFLSRISSQYFSEPKIALLSHNQYTCAIHLPLIPNPESLSLTTVSTLFLPRVTSFYHL